METPKVSRARHIAHDPFSPSAWSRWRAHGPRSSGINKPESLFDDRDRPRASQMADHVFPVAPRFITTIELRQIVPFTRQHILHLEKRGAFVRSEVTFRSGDMEDTAPSWMNVCASLPAASMADDDRGLPPVRHLPQDRLQAVRALSAGWARRARRPLAPPCPIRQPVARPDRKPDRHL